MEQSRRDLSFQSFTQHATLFWPGFNSEFVFPLTVDSRLAVGRTVDRETDVDARRRSLATRFAATRFTATRFASDPRSEILSA